MDLTDIIYSNDYINILIQNYVAQSERYQMLFPESSALLTLNSQYSVLFLERMALLISSSAQFSSIRNRRCSSLSGLSARITAHELRKRCTCPV